jgi:hypothetical protein
MFDLDHTAMVMATMGSEIRDGGRKNRNLEVVWE